MLNYELPVWVARIVGLSLFVLGIAMVVGGGTLFGILFAAVGMSIALSKKKTRRRKCPFCAEMVKREAQVCKHCHREIPEQNSGG